MDMEVSYNGVVRLCGWPAMAKMLGALIIGVYRPSERLAR